VNVGDEFIVFYIFRLQTMTESTWKILKLDWKTPGFLFSSKEWELFGKCVFKLTCFLSSGTQ